MCRCVGAISVLAYGRPTAIGFILGSELVLPANIPAAGDLAYGSVRRKRSR